MSRDAVHVLILAGRRGGDDPVARSAGVSHKACARIAGIPIAERVATTLRASLPDSALGIAIDESTETRRMLDALTSGNGVTVVPVGESPCATIASALAREDMAAPLLITTADHPLLTPAIVHYFLDHLPAGIDAAVGVATRQTVSAAYPGMRRTYWRFRDKHVSGCNLFYLGTANAARVVAFWRQLENDRKRPWAIVRRLGLGSLLRFLCGRLSLAQGLSILERKVGARLAVVDMPFAEAAIDVDRPADLQLAEEILRRSS